MKRQLKRGPVGQTEMRYIVTFTSDELDLSHGETGKRVLQHSLLKALVDQPNLMLCGTEPFQKMTMKWMGLIG